ncbi:uncharacterized protein J7T54_007102 [Emericellopsis cladophorae]|uniref:Ribosome biogenesis protein SLX9 n=1 Tax=Emericellopsis cladophorae TaxID=2686198 RepID=A0A9P9Y9H8_9HYPO|nr:uncharacterized protein J7T54_007102 [Emericellopsis cladophorae]KAI6785460.1 hypothetical protein J7T54_007102 [Emericellopsis cladophorae]
MAPTAPPSSKPSARTLRHQRITGQIHPLLPSKLFRPDAQVSDSFISSKRDKRTIKHSSFLSKIQSTPHAQNRVGKNKGGSGHRRHKRPGNKLTALDGLEDALPDVSDAPEMGKVRARSLKSRPGALKRKERMMKGEMERFGMNMANLANLADQAPSKTQESMEGQEVKSKEDQGRASRWAALRGYVSSTMEQNPAFADKL